MVRGKRDIEMRKSVILLLMAAGMVLSTSVTFSRDCDATVVDEAGVLGSKAGSVERAAADLVAVGADVRVLVVSSFGSAGNLDVYKEQVQRSCSSWQAPDGDIKNNMVVIVVAINEKKAGIYGGSLWEEEFGSHTDQIRSEEMGPYFRQNDWAGGLTASLKRITQYIQEYRTASRSTGVGTVIVQTPAVPSKPVDLTGLWWMVGILIFLGVIAAIVYAILQQRKEAEARRTAQQRALASKAQCARALSALREPMDFHESVIDALASKCSDEDVEPLREKFRQLQSDHGTASTTFADTSTSANNPEDTGRTVAEYVAIERTYDGQYRVLSDVQTGSSELALEVVKLKSAIDGAATQLQQAEAAITAAQSVITQIAGTGFTVTGPTATLAQASTALKQGREAVSAKRITAGLGYAQQAASKAEEASSAAKALPALKQSLVQRVTDLSARAESVPGFLQGAREVFARISSSYTPNSWTTIRGNGTEAEVRLEHILQQLQAANTAVTMEQQRWADAENALKDVEVKLNEIDSLIRSILELDKHLARAKADAPTEIAAAQADIDKARGYIARYDDDIKEELEGQLQEAAALVQQSQAELDSDQPDYLKVVQLAQQANTTADGILDEAQNEHEAAERKRQRATSSIRDAKASVSAAKEYIEDHSGDVESQATQYLSQATQALAASATASTPDQQIVYGARAKSQAEQALNSAQQDVSQAESARRRRAAARDAAAHRDWGTTSISIGSSISHGGGSSFGSSGSSIGGGHSFGSSGSSFGGGHSFGSSGGW